LDLDLDLRVEDLDSDSEDLTTSVLIRCWGVYLIFNFAKGGRPTLAPHEWIEAKTQRWLTLVLR